MSIDNCLNSRLSTETSENKRLPLINAFLYLSCTESTMNTISVDDIKKILVDNYVVYVKYVRIGDTYRFALDADYFTPNHSQMLKNGETAKSAGGFKLYRDGLEWETLYSTTLHIGVAQDDEDNLTKLFALPD